MSVVRWLLGIAERASDARIALALGALAVVAYVAAAYDRPTHFDYFGRLAVALTEGRYWLDDVPPHLNELVVGVGGHKYHVVPPLPALLLMPLVPFGEPGDIQTFLSAVAGAAAVAPIFLALRRLGVPRAFAVLASLLSAFGTMLWVTSVDGRSWFAADALAVLLLSLALWAAVSGKSPLVVGVLLGASALARAPTALAAPALLLLMPGRPLLRSALALAVGAAPFVAIEAAYNIARWGTPLEVGYGLLSANDPFYARGIFSITYLPRHIYAMFFEPPAFVDGELAFLRARMIGMSLVVVTPALLWMFRVPFAARSYPAVGALALGLLPLVPDMLFGTVGFEQYGYRRALDVHPFLIALVAVAAGWRDGRWAERPSGLFLFAVGLSIAVNLYFLVTIRIFGFVT